MNKTCMVVLLASLAFGGCSKKSSGSGGDCAAAVDKGVQAMMNGTLERVPEDQKAAMQGQMKETGDKLKEILTRHCVDDKWSAEVIDCYNKAASQPEIRACRSKLPQDQAEKLGADVRQVMMAAGMRGMHGGMHGGPGAPGPPCMAVPARRGRLTTAARWAGVRWAAHQLVARPAHRLAAAGARAVHRPGARVARRPRAARRQRRQPSNQPRVRSRVMFF